MYINNNAVPMIGLLCNNFIFRITDYSFIIESGKTHFIKIFERKTNTNSSINETLCCY